jgi:hypothetical protein
LPADPEFAKKQEEVAPNGLTMYGDFKYNGYKWGMAIDQNVCTGLQLVRRRLPG